MIETDAPDKLPLEPYKYRAVNGKIQFRPRIQDLQEMEDDCVGFCLACGSDSTPAEPDAARYECEDCGAHKVYGPAELALRGICY